MVTVPLPGSERQEPPGSRIGVPSPDERFSISVVLRPGSSKGERFPRRLANQRLSHEEFAAVHGADSQDVARIEAFAAENNLSVEGVYPARRTVDLSATTADFGKAFQVELALYEYKGKTFRGYAGPTYVPAELVPLIQGIFGLDDRPAGRPQGPATNPAGNNLLDVAKAYHFPTGVDCTGTTIGIIELEGGYEPVDLSTFWQQDLGLGTFPTVVDVSIDGTGNNPGQDDIADKEATFDIEIVGGIAPGAKIVVYFTRGTVAGQLHAIQTAVGDINNAPSIISMSFGQMEDDLSPNDKLTIDQVFQDAAALSITLFCSTGDNGSIDRQSSGQHVEFPASSPNVTACGGSTLTIVGGAIQTETVWNDDPAKAATGGGVSDFYPLPAYQNGVGVPPPTNPVGGRGVPDVAGHAGGISCRFKGEAVPFGGTSAVAPLWAGLIALINQSHSQRTGFLNEILYGRLAPQGALNDITAGDNGFFHAGVGWDACTGWGSPNGGLIASLLGPPTITFVSPVAGPVGGGIPITIQGRRLFGASLVSFGGTDTKDFHVDDDTQITVRLPENIGDGTVTVTVTTASGTGSGGPNSDFSYVFPIPVIQSINPTSGNVAGVDPININGLGFTGTISVSFNNAGVVPTSVTDNQITVTPPPSSSSGPIDVTVTTPGGQSAPSQFTYVIPGPVVTNVNPSSGSVGGGDPVTITGTGFTNVFSVDFDGALQPLAFTLVDDAHIAMFSPPGSGVGPVSVSVTSPGGTSQIDSRAQFTYF